MTTVATRSHPYAASSSWLPNIGNEAGAEEAREEAEEVDETMGEAEMTVVCAKD
jgi:hypothetical protein